MVRPDEPMESVEDPMGLQRPADRDETPDAADLADALSELPEARIVRTPGTPREVLESDAASATRDGLVRRARLGRRRHHLPGVGLPARRLSRPRRGRLVPASPPAGSGAWVEERHGPPRDPGAAGPPSLRRPPAPPRALRRQDGRDGARPLGLRDGVRRLAGRAVRARIASTPPTRPARRDLAIALLVDTSESTDGWVGGGQRIIDVEKEALVVLLEALDALGDRYAVLAFSGEGPGGVRVLTVKAFEEPVGRGGAAPRRGARARWLHANRRGASATPARCWRAQRARHRLLLMLSDGKPNDVDEYEGRYGIEDTRQAVAEARLQGIVPFCLTVDREAPAYLPSIFGPRGYALLRRQELLPAVLVEVVRRLLIS